MSAMGYEYELVDGGVRLLKYTGSASALAIPERIEDKPVTALAPYAFEGNAHASSIVCPPTVTEIGSRAFANCPALERIAFPAELARYDNSWVAGCAQLHEIALPGSVADLDLLSPAPLGIRHIRIGALTQTVHLSRSWKTRLEQVSVHPDNRWLSADGTCIYSADGTELLAHATRASSVSVAPGCVRVAQVAFRHEQHLREVTLPASLLEIGQRAFAESALTRLDAPESLQSVDAEAFAGCKSLVSVNLGRSLREIGERAFADCSSCERIVIPENVERIGRKAFEGSGLRACGDDATLTVDAANPKLFIDGCGVLCERGSDGTVVLEALDQHIDRYVTPEDAVCIADRAFFRHPSLQELEVREGVTLIGNEAFMGCAQLHEASLPKGLKRLGDRAFATCALRSCEVPASVEYLGQCALAFNYKDWHPTTNPPEARAHITLEPGNARYFVEGGLLYERCDAGARRVVVYVGPEIDVCVSPETLSIAPYAFFGVQGIRELRLPEGILTGEATFAMRKPPERIVIEGTEGVELTTMHDWRGVCALQRAFADGGTTSARRLCATFDEEALSAQPDFEAFRYMTIRLAEPAHLGADEKGSFEHTLHEHLGEACVEFGRHDCLSQIDQLVKIGLIDQDAIAGVIETASSAHNAATMARLHAIKRGLSPADIDDYRL